MPLDRKTGGLSCTDDEHCAGETTRKPIKSWKDFMALTTGDLHSLYTTEDNKKYMKFRFMQNNYNFNMKRIYKKKRFIKLLRLKSWEPIFFSIFCCPSILSVQGHGYN